MDLLQERETKFFFFFFFLKAVLQFYNTLILVNEMSRIA